METTTQELLIDININADDAIKAAGEQTNAIAKLREQNNALKKEQAEARKDGKDETEAYKARGQAIASNEAQLKTLSSALNNNQKVQKLLTTETKDATGAYQLLQNQYSVAAQRAKDLTVAYGANSAEAKKATTTAKAMSDQLKEVDASVGQNQRNVGNYTSVLGMLPGGFGRAASGAQGFGTTLKALSANPILLVLTAIVGVVILLSKAFSQNGAAVEKMNQVMAPFKVVISATMKVLGDVVEVLIDGALAVVKFTSAIVGFITGQDKANTSVSKAIQLEKERQLIAEQERADLVDDAKLREKVGELKKTLGQKDKYTAQERLAAAKEIDRLEKANMLDDMNRQIRRHNNLMAQYKLEGKAYKDLTTEQKDAVRQSEAAIYNIKAEYFEKTKRSASTEAKTAAEIEADKAAANEKAASNREKRHEAELKKMETNLQISQAKQKEITMQGALDTWNAEKAIIDTKVKYGKLTTEEAILARLQAENKYNETITDLANKQYDQQQAVFAKRIQAITDFETEYYSIEEQASAEAAARINENNLSEFENRMIIAEGNLEAEFAMKQEYLDKQKEAELSNASLTAEQIALINEKYRQQEIALEQQKTQAKLNIASSLFGSLKDIFGKGTIASKVAASAQVGIDSVSGAFAAFTGMVKAIPGPAGLVAGGVAAAGVVASGVKAISDIWKVKEGSKSVSVSAPSTSVGSTASSPVSVAGSLAIRSVGTNPTTQVEQGVSNALANNPQQTVLVIDDVTKAIDRKVSIRENNTL